jgi:hypothetical protein
LSPHSAISIFALLWPRVSGRITSIRLTGAPASGGCWGSIAEYQYFQLIQ